MIYALYHREGAAGDGAAIDSQEFDKVHKDSAKTTPYLPIGHDYVYQNAKGGEYKKDNEFRVYINASSGASSGIVGFIVKECFKSKYVSGFKMVKDVKAFDGFADPIAIYCDEGVAVRIADLLATNKPKLGIYGPSVHFASENAPGIAIGQSPRDPACSFGQLRALAIARALHCYFLDIAESPDNKIQLGEAVRESFDRFKIKYENAYLNA